MTDPKPPTIYCKHCGKKMIVHKQSVEEYNEDTGNPVIKFEMQCPDRSFLSRHSIAGFLFFQEKNPWLRRLY